MMGRRRSETSGTRPLAAAIIASALAPLVVYAVIRTAAVGLQPAAGAVMPPIDMSGVMRPLVLAAAAPPLPVTEEMRSIARRALVTAPLTFEPFFIEARAADRGGVIGGGPASSPAPERSIRLMEEAKRRQLSFLPTRMNLGDYYYRIAHYREALREIDYILRVSPEARQAVLPQFVNLMRAREGREALADLLTREPAWSEDFFRAAKQEHLAPQLTLSLYQLVARRNRGPSLLRARELHLRALADTGQFRASRALALAGLSERQRAAQTPVFDPDFRGLRGTLPFTWELSDTATGRAVPETANGQPYLDVSYFGGSNMILADQTLALEPGSYRLQFMARSAGGTSAATIYWSLSCLPRDQQVARVPLQNIGASYRQLGAAFAIPASNCPGQRLRLVAEAGEEAGSVNAQIMQLGIVHAG